MRILKYLTSQPSPAKEHYNKAKTLFQEGEYQQCLQELGNGFRKDINYKPLFSLASDSLDNIGATEEKALFETALNDFRNFEPFNNIGIHFLESEYYTLAEPFFKKALELNNDNSDIAHDLSISLARQFQLKKAIEILESYKSDFWNLFFLTKCQLLLENSTETNHSIKILHEALINEKQSPELEFPKLKVLELEEIYIRLKAIEKPNYHIRDWHFIQYGGAILDYFDDMEEFVAGGRYVATWGSLESIKDTAVKLKTFLKAMSPDIEYVKYLPDRNSEIIAIVIAHELGLDYSLYDPEFNNANSLIVAGDSSAFNAFDQLNHIDKGQILFTLNHNWLQSSFIAPDIIGFMSQMYSFPWDGGGIRIINPENGETELTEADLRSELDIALEIIEMDAGVPMPKETIDFYLNHKELLKSIGNKSGNYRYNFMIESPVAGSHFG